MWGRKGCRKNDSAALDRSTLPMAEDKCTGTQAGDAAEMLPAVVAAVFSGSMSKPVPLGAIQKVIPGAKHLSLAVLALERKVVVCTNNLIGPHKVVLSLLPARQTASWAVIAQCIPLAGASWDCASQQQLHDLRAAHEQSGCQLLLASPITMTLNGTRAPLYGSVLAGFDQGLNDKWRHRDAALLGLVKLAQALGPLLVVPAAQLVHDISKYVLSPAVFPALAAQVESDEEDADAATDEEFADLPGCRLAAHEDSEGDRGSDGDDRAPQPLCHSRPDQYHDTGEVFKKPDTRQMASQSHDQAASARLDELLHQNTSAETASIDAGPSSELQSSGSILHTPSQNLQRPAAGKKNLALSKGAQLYGAPSTAIRPAQSALTLCFKDAALERAYRLWSADKHVKMDFWLTLHVIMLMVLGSISPSHKYYQHIPAYLIADICIAIAPLFVIHFCPDWYRRYRELVIAPMLAATMAMHALVIIPTFLATSPADRMGDVAFVLTVAVPIFLLLVALGYAVRFCTFVPVQLLQVAISNICVPAACTAAASQWTRSYRECIGKVTATSAVIAYVAPACILRGMEVLSRRRFLLSNQAA